MSLRVSMTIALLARAALAQQVADLEFKPAVGKAAWPEGKGPRVAIDEGHHNFHTATGRYQPFAALLARDGYRVEGRTGAFTATALAGIDVLVVSNALHERNEESWALPTPSAFTADEIAAVKKWVEQGGSLLLISDHMPFPGAAFELARAFGVELSNGFAGKSAEKATDVIVFDLSTGLRKSPVTAGRGAAEKITSVATFTGSAFRLPDGARAVLVFPGGAVSLTPEKAWEFTEKTPKAPIAGWSQGGLLAVGKGRVAVFGEAAMFSAQLAGPEKKPMGFNAPQASQNGQLALNVLHWLSRCPGMPE